MPAEQFLLVLQQEIDQGLVARYPLAREGVVKERLMEERHAVAVPYKDVFGDEDVGVLDEVTVVRISKGTDSTWRSLAAFATRLSTSLNLTPLHLARAVCRLRSQNASNSDPLDWKASASS